MKVTIWTTQDEKFTDTISGLLANPYKIRDTVVRNGGYTLLNEEGVSFIPISMISLINFSDDDDT